MKDIAVCIVDVSRDLRYALVEIIDMSDGFKCVDTLGIAQEAIVQIPFLTPGYSIVGYQPG